MTLKNIIHRSLKLNVIQNNNANSKFTGVINFKITFLPTNTHFNEKY